MSNNNATTEVAIPRQLVLKAQSRNIVITPLNAPLSVERLSDLYDCGPRGAALRTRYTAALTIDPVCSVALGLFMAVTVFYHEHRSLTMRDEVRSTLSELHCLVRNEHARQSDIRKILSAAAMLFGECEASHDERVHKAIHASLATLEAYAQ